MSDNSSVSPPTDFEVGQVLGAWAAWRDTAGPNAEAMRGAAGGISETMDAARTLAGTLPTDDSRGGQMRRKLLEVADAAEAAVTNLRATARAIEESRRLMDAAARAGGN